MTSRTKVVRRKVYAKDARKGLFPSLEKKGSGYLEAFDRGLKVLSYFSFSASMIFIMVTIGFSFVFSAFSIVHILNELGGDVQPVFILLRFWGILLQVAVLLFSATIAFRIIRYIMEGKYYGN